jgi:hypothetical protein
MRHGHRSKGEESPEYSSWRAMLERCYNPKSISYPHYGARGITVCPRWRASFSAFFADMGPRPEGMTIDRKDNELGYLCGNCPDCGRVKNCRWASWHDQIQGQRRCGNANLARARLNQVLKLRKKGASTVELASRYRVSQSFICKLLRSAHGLCK